jgi:hypothetical protein
MILSLNIINWLVFVMNTLWFLYIVLMIFIIKFQVVTACFCSSPSNLNSSELNSLAWKSPGYISKLCNSELIKKSAPFLKVFHRIYIYRDLSPCMSRWVSNTQALNNLHAWNLSTRPSADYFSKFRLQICQSCFSISISHLLFLRSDMHLSVCSSIPESKT